MGKKRKLKPRNYIAGYNVKIQNHVVERYMKRAGVSYEEAERTLMSKFRNSKLTRIKRNKSEVRKEVGGSMNKRLTFYSYFVGRTKTFYVTTCFLQGPADNWWKNEGLIEEFETDAELEAKWAKQERKVTEEMQKLMLREEVRHG